MPGTIQPIFNEEAPEFGSKEYIDYWYNKGMAIKALYGAKGMPITPMSKAVGPWDPPSSPYGEYFDPKFSAEVLAWVMRYSTVFSVLRKTTFQRYGDSFKSVSYTHLTLPTKRIV